MPEQSQRIIATKFVTHAASVHASYDEKVVLGLAMALPDYVVRHLAGEGESALKVGETA